ncbi:MAG TPA: hypothetical protein ENJ99_04325, partial [Rhizobiales bacterium]|nr:hypothetical protein [Hyphomicrobiales bacterium]
MTPSTQADALPHMPETTEGLRQEPFVGFRRGGSGRLGAVLVVLAVILGISTFAILTGLTPVKPTRTMVTG